MKKILFVLLIAITIAGSAFASGENEARSGVVSHFKVKFKKASNPLISPNTEMSKAEMVINGKRTEVFYDANGELIGSQTKTAVKDLPESIQEQVIEATLGYTIKEAFIFKGPEETAYLISAGNDKETIVLKVDESSNMTDTKTSKN